MLINRSDPQFLRVFWIFDFRFLPVYKDFPFIGKMDTRNDLDKGGFARSVLSHQCVDLPGAKLKVHLIQRLNSWKRFRNPSQFKNAI